MPLIGSDRAAGLSTRIIAQALTCDLRDSPTVHGSDMTFSIEISVAVPYTRGRRAVFPRHSLQHTLGHDQAEHDHLA